MATGVEKQKDYYISETKRLQLRLDRLQKTATGIAEQNSVLTSREQVLLSLSTKQAWIAHVVDSLQEAKQQDQQLVMSAVLPASADSCGLQLLRSATTADWEQARAITPQGWCVFFSNLVAKLLTYQDIVLRDETAAAASLGESNSLNCVSVIANSAGSAGSSIIAKAAAMKLVDEFPTRVVLAHFTCNCNMMSYMLASRIDLSTGQPAGETPESHWIAAVAAAKLTPQQVQHLQETYTFFLRQKQAMKVQQLAASSKLALATECTSQQLNNSAAAAGQLSATETEESLQAKLQGTLLNLQLLNLLVLLEMLDVLRPFQRMQMLIGSYPLMPRVAALLEAVCLLQQQQQQQQDKQQQQQQQQQRQQSTKVQPEHKVQQRLAQQNSVHKAVPSLGTAASSAAAGIAAGPAHTGISLVHETHVTQLQHRQAQLTQQRHGYWARLGSQLQQLSQITGKDVAAYLGLKA